MAGCTGACSRPLSLPRPDTDRTTPGPPPAHSEFSAHLDDFSCTPHHMFYPCVHPNPAFSNWMLHRTSPVGEPTRGSLGKATPHRNKMTNFNRGIFAELFAPLFSSRPLGHHFWGVLAVLSIASRLASLLSCWHPPAAPTDTTNRHTHTKGRPVEGVTKSPAYPVTLAHLLVGYED
jgi:hypothetical protein